MQPIRIDDWDDARISDYRNLKDAQLLAQRKRFIVEGRGNLRVLLTRSRFSPESIMLSERAFTALQDELAGLALACPIFVAEQALLDRIVGFPIHRGVLAAVARPEPQDPAALLGALRTREKAPRVLVLEGVSDHDNIGGLFRNAMALGARAVFLCARSSDPLYRKSIRTSMGGTLCVPFARMGELPAFLTALRATGFTLLALDPAAENEDLATLHGPSIGPAAVLVGAEGAGLSEAALGAADLRLRIGMEADVDSLNVSVAAAIALHRLRRENPASD